MNKLLPIGTLLLLFAGCATPAPAVTSDPYYQHTVDAFSSLVEPIRTGPPDRYQEPFDATEFFSILDHLSVEPDYVLDYVWQRYAAGGLENGHPVLYARPEGVPLGQAEEAFWDEAAETGWQWEEYWYNYLGRIQIDGTPEGFFQFVVLRVMGNQFYLAGHSHEFDATIVCDQMGLEAVLTTPDTFDQVPPQDARDKAKRLELQPIIEMEDDVVVVQVIVFTKWGGFRQQRYEISKDFPHRILGETVQILVPYDCGCYY